MQSPSVPSILALIFFCISCTLLPVAFDEFKNEKLGEYYAGQKSKKEQRAELVYDLGMYLMTSAPKGSTPTEIAALHQEILNHYNTLRELSNMPLATSYRAIDHTWLDAQAQHPDYKEWLEQRSATQHEQPEKGAWNIELEPLRALITKINHNLDHLALHADDKAAEQQLRHDYNFLRKLLHKPPIDSVSDINTAWLSQVEEESLAQTAGFERPTYAQLTLLRQAQKIIGMKKNIAAASVTKSESGHAGYRHVAICKDPDLDRTLGLIYHELGHIMHNDAYFGEQVSQQKISAQKIMERPEFKTDTRQITQYLNLGKKALDSSTSLGKYLRKILRKQTTFWNPPADQETYTQSLYQMNSEQRADLFELRELFKQNRIDTILSEIDYFALREPTSEQHIVASEDATHPSDVERALYMIGFLVEKGIDVNGAIRQYESEGICISREDLYKEETPPAKKPGARAFQKAYKEQLAAEKIIPYEQWKHEKLAQYAKENKNKREIIEDLVDSYKQEAMRYNPETRAYKQALYIYNLIDELLGTDFAKKGGLLTRPLLSSVIRHYLPQPGAPAEPLIMPLSVQNKEEL